VAECIVGNGEPDGGADVDAVGLVGAGAAVLAQWIRHVERIISDYLKI
jgi:hypothetical protein